MTGLAIKRKEKKFMKKRLVLLLSAICVFSMSISSFAASCEHKNTEKTEQIDPTCISEGYTEGTFCNDCQKYISGHKLISALGHIDSNKDGICDDCGIKFSIKKAKNATCTQDGYTGDKESNGRILIGESIPKTGHKDNNHDYICDICHEAITKEDIKITLHYYVLNEEYEKNIDQYTGKNFIVKDSNEIPGCKYITEKRIEQQNTEFEVPKAPNLKQYQFAWMNKNTVYTTFIFDNDTELYMGYNKGSERLEGQAGDAAYYIYHPEEHCLEFTGHGTLWDDFNVKAEIPWYKYLMLSEKIYMDEGLTATLWVLQK